MPNFAQNQMERSTHKQPFIFFFLGIIHRYPYLLFYGLWLILSEQRQTPCRENSPNVVFCITKGFEPETSC